MKKNFKKWTRLGLSTIALLFLFAVISVTASYAQSTQKRDSACICGTEKEIDSTLKILNDYPDLLKSRKLIEAILADERTILKAEREAICKVLGLEAWDKKKAVRRIRLYKWRGYIGWVGGVAVGGTVIMLKK